MPHLGSATGYIFVMSMVCKTTDEVLIFIIMRSNVYLLSYLAVRTTGVVHVDYS